MMLYSTEDVAKTLKSARLDKGVSQHELAKRVGVPQSHISKIESGAVDLRLSSLVEIARALDLEVTLVPQKNVSAVHSIVRESRTGRFIEAESEAGKELTRIQRTLGRLAGKYPELKEVAQAQRRVRDLSHLPLPVSSAARLADARKALESFYRTGRNQLVLTMALHEIQGLRNELAHGVHVMREPARAKPAYSLEDDSDG